jgi:hypothetical protein
MDDISARPLVAASAGSHIILPNYLCPPGLGKFFVFVCIYVRVRVCVCGRLRVRVRVRLHLCLVRA